MVEFFACGHMTRLSKTGGLTAGTSGVLTLTNEHRAAPARPLHLTERRLVQPQAGFRPIRQWQMSLVWSWRGYNVFYWGHVESGIFNISPRSKEGRQAELQDVDKITETPSEVINLDSNMVTRVY